MNGVGKPLYVNALTKNLHSSPCACVEVSADKPLVDCLDLDLEDELPAEI